MKWKDSGKGQNKFSINAKNNIMIQGLLGEATGRGSDPAEAIGAKSLLTLRGDEPVIRLDNAIFTL